MRERVAKTKTEKTAWDLIAKLHEACPCNHFAVVLKAPGSGYEIIPINAVHPLDRQVIKNVVAEFAKQAKVV